MYVSKTSQKLTIISISFILFINRLTQNSSKKHMETLVTIKVSIVLRANLDYGNSGKNIDQGA